MAISFSPEPMNTRLSYYTLYATLELPQDASSEQLRLHYRRLAQRLHPDAPTGDSEQFQQLHSAYDTLRRYYLLHGQMPLQHPGNLSREACDSGNIHDPRSAADATTAGIRRHPVPVQSLLKRHAGTLCLSALAASILWHQFSQPSVNPSPLAANESTQRVVAAEKTFSIGAGITDVVDAQGIPDSSDNDIWVYGNSRVFFFEGKVAGWDDVPESPLNLTRELTLSSQPFFALGAPAQDVFRAQGVPNHMSKHEWRYGLSSIYFRHNRVTGWHEDPANPLAIERLAPTPK